jgi:hypothetical protein
MKTKLTLTVRKSVITIAKKHSRKSGKSISRLFEEMFEEPELNIIKSEQQRAASRLLKLLESAPRVKTLDDKALLRKHIDQKYA